MKHTCTTAVEERPKQKKAKRSKTASETFTSETVTPETATISKEKKSKKRTRDDEEPLSKRSDPRTEGEPAISSVSHPLVQPSSSGANSSAAAVTEGMLTFQHILAL
jgi:hypothetical protein